MRDLIDRQQAIDEFWKLEIETRPSWIDAVMNMLNSLPSAQPNVYVSTKDADCISRSQALNAINVGGDLEGAWINAAKLPSAQPEIIRCKDCKHYYFAGNRVPEEQSWVCDVWHVNQTAHMGYCFKAERRSDE